VRAARRLRQFGEGRADVVTAVLLGVLVVVGEVTKEGSSVAMVVGLAAVAPVAMRWRWPAPATFVIVVSITLFKHLGGSSPAPSVAIALAYYTLGRRSSFGSWRPLDLLLLALAAPAIALGPAHPDILDVASLWVLFALIPYAIAMAISGQRALTEELARKAARLQRGQEQRSKEAAVRERTRVARELHDVVAHNVSVMVIQAGAAGRAVDVDRSAARQALLHVESCGREALVEIRRMIGIVRRDEIELARPGLWQLHELAQRSRAAGLPVEVVLEGEPRELATPVDLVALRVVQEALTNALKHAGAARAEVRVTFAPSILRLEVSDTGKGDDAMERDCKAPRGHGLVGMRERVALYGGDLVAGPRPGGGYRVSATIPTGEVT
jgi:signal transduction histidine kinase